MIDDHAGFDDAPRNSQLNIRPWMATLVLALAPALAAAEQRPTLPAGSATAYGEIVVGPATIDDLRFARQVLPPIAPPAGGTAALAQSRVIYLNKDGVTLTPGTNDARTNRSSIVTQTTTIAPWSVSPTTWSATVACMRDVFAAWDVTIVEADPGNVPHIEAVFAGSPTQLGLDPTVAGISPFTTDCAVIESSIVFTFTQVLPADARLACEIMAQEVAHSYGLDHELLAPDPLSYLAYDGNRSFQNQAAACGETTARPCGIGGSACRPDQNSVALLTERLGLRKDDTIPPTANIVSPGHNATVPPGFSVYADVADNLIVATAMLYIDGTLTNTLTSGPFTFTTPSTLAEGSHRLRIDVSDGANVAPSQEITVTVKLGASPPLPPPGAAGNGSYALGAPDVGGGCSTGGGRASLLLGLALVGLLRRRRAGCSGDRLWVRS